MRTVLAAWFLTMIICASVVILDDIFEPEVSTEGCVVQTVVYPMPEWSFQEYPRKAWMPRNI
jgi:hypothetical protein